MLAGPRDQFRGLMRKPHNVHLALAWAWHWSGPGIGVFASFASQALYLVGSDLRFVGRRRALP
jgi:hypothetical protein